MGAEPCLDQGISSTTGCSDEQRPGTASTQPLALTSVVQVVMVLLILDGEVCLAPQGTESQQPRAAASDRRDARWLEARGVRRQLDRGPMGGVGEVLGLELLLLQ